MRTASFLPYFLSFLCILPGFLFPGAVLNAENPSVSISATASSGGTITPNGTFSVPHMSGQTFYLVPDPGYHIVSLYVDGINMGALPALSYGPITTALTVVANFAPNVPSNTITATAGSGGTISPNGTTSVVSGNNQIYMITPDPGYAIENISIDGVSVGAVSTYTFHNVMDPHSIDVVFVPDHYMVNSSA